VGEGLGLDVLCAAEAGAAEACPFPEVEEVSLCAAWAGETNSMSNAQGRRVAILRIAIKTAKTMSRAFPVPRCTQCYYAPSVASSGPFPLIRL
jgi:hypothetical protein